MAEEEPLDPNKLGAAQIGGNLEEMAQMEGRLYVRMGDMEAKRSTFVRLVSIFLAIIFFLFPAGMALSFLIENVTSEPALQTSDGIYYVRVLIYILLPSIWAFVGFKIIYSNSRGIFKSKK